MYLQVALFTSGLPVNLPQREFKFPLFPVTELHNVELSGYPLKSSLNSLGTDVGRQAGPEYPVLQLCAKCYKCVWVMCSCI